MNRDFFNTLGLCRRAGFISWGHDAALDSVKRHKAKLCIMTSDASERLKKEFERASQFDGMEVEIVYLQETMDDMRSAIGVRAAVITVNDDGFVKLLRKHMEN